MVLIGNKDDLIDERTVPYEMPNQLAANWHIPYIETSAKTRHNLNEVSSLFTCHSAFYQTGLFINALFASGLRCLNHWW
ncbi:unnamed protein product [Echinostoma caproni]|uniref:Small monomeric GTPase n=1 Tax=Echinostoma caproni TaxID=27848 RepID=A0A183A2G9_9TREM|nr:unnamed protein product [Echinostoma caproni]